MQRPGRLPKSACLQQISLISSNRPRAGRVAEGSGENPEIGPENSLSGCNLTDNAENGRLTDIDWVLYSIGQDKVEYGSYAILFKEDGNADIIADCNDCMTTYELTGGDSLSISRPGCTKVGCPPGSRGVDFVNCLENSTTYFATEDELTIYC